ncbi:MAG: hypothetical protein BWY70_01482 [Bacteroidetes bacterium ADurb.Bin408]|nr:MAG: hypothetical protein BWY70_01482 [Bacteroidetes bacterium ADurb.Bin408]
MKKITFLMLIMAVTMQVTAQFFHGTTYRGAFGDATSTDWTSGWANWDPENTPYPATNTTVSTDITTNTTWATGQVILLQNKVYVTNNATLTIQPGVIIRGDKNTEGTLIITKGAKIMAEGTAANPIVFTSNFDNDGSRGPGDWGGLIILGNAVNNQGSAVVEGGLDPVKASYGGSDNNDNSGVLRYVRIEFGGFPFQPDKEINGLTMGSVGAGTTIEYIQVSFNNDDAFEWFGGNVNCRHLISYRNLDDDFDTDFGYSGNVQFALGIRDPNIADQSASSTSEGFESDNDGSGTTATPLTSAVFSNVTLIGPYRGSTSNSIDAKFRRALRIRRNSSISVFNSIFTDFPTGLHIDGNSSETNATNNNLKFKNNVLAGMGTNLQVNSGSTFDILTFFLNGNNDTLNNAGNVQFVNPYPDLTALNIATPDYRLQSASPMLTGADFTDPKFGTVIWANTENHQLENNFTVFPNPSNGIVNITSQVSNYEIRIINLLGETVYINASGNTSGVYDLNHLPCGIYVLKITTLKNQFTVKLFLNK